MLPDESDHASNPSPPDLQAFYQSMYKEERDQARQHEALRQQSTTLIFALSGVISTATGAIIGTTAIPLLNWGKWGSLVVAFYSVFGLFVSTLGWLGRRLSFRHFELSDMHFKYAREYRLRLQNMFPGSAIAAVEEKHSVRDLEDRSADRIGTTPRYAYEYWMDLYIFLIVL
jgi:hypothetical protein